MKCVTTLGVALVVLLASLCTAGPKEPPHAQAATQDSPTSPATTRPLTPAARPVPAIRHVLIVSVDGLRPDLLVRASAPNLRALMNAGTFTLWARTTAQAVTLPSHMSMLTGVTPQRHQIQWNHDLPLSKPVYPKGYTLFDLARRYGYTTALVSGKGKFDIFDRPGALDWRWVAPKPADEPATRPAAERAEPAIAEEWPDDSTKARKEKLEDATVAAEAVKIIREHRPDLTFVHLPHVDNVGHLLGWGTPEQIRAVGDADLALGQILEALEDAGLTDATLVVVTADHGGAGRTHGADDPRSRHIPWVAAGPGVRRNFDLTRYPDLTVNTEDTFATACFFLGMKAPPGIDGKAIREVVRVDELLRAAK
jgi:hypothetical protein